MKKQLLAALFSVLASFSFAQITVTQADYASVGDTVILAVDTLPSISVGSTGLQSWDFTALQSNFLDTVAYIDPSTTPNGSDFAGSNLALEKPAQNEYFTSSSTMYTYDGFDGDPTGLGQTNTFVFSDKQVLVTFPATYNDSDVDTAYGEVKVDAMAISGGQVDSVWVKHTGYSSATMDAYGNLTLLNGTYNTLRQSGTEISIDSVYIYVSNAVVAGFLGVPANQWVMSPIIAGIIDQNPIMDTIYTHKWIANGEKHPIVEATMDALGGNPTLVEFRAGGAVTLNMTSTNISCSGDCDGTITATPSTGISPYTYIWNDPMMQTTETATGLCAGTYDVTVVDALGDSADGSMTLNDPTPMTAQSTGGYLQCNGSAGSGTISVSPIGGTGPFTYMWSNGATDNALTGLNLSTYDVTVTDASGCEADTSFTIMDPPVLGLSVTSTDVLCNGESNGTASASVTGGISPYSYNWNNGDMTLTVSGYAAGTASVTVTDSLGCSINNNVMISEPSVLSDTIISSPGTGVLDGTATPTGGVSPYSYLWSNGDTTAQTTDGAGMYFVTVSDANGCSIVDSIEFYVSIEEFNSLITNIYPNPTTGLLTIELDENITSQLVITDITGKQVYAEQFGEHAKTIDLTDLTPGNYLLRITNYKGTINRKLILTK